MSDYSSVLNAARLLSERERISLIDALWDSISLESNATLSEEWVTEIQRRVAELDAGIAKPVPWSQIRDEVLGRIDHGRGG